MIALKNVTKSYGSNKVLSGASFEVKPKECVYIVGAAGSGKTTLFSMIAHAQKPTSGSIEIDGINSKSIPPNVLQLFRKRVGMMFQEPVLLEHATVEENIALPLELAGAPAQVIHKSVLDLMKRMQLDAKRNDLPSALSMAEKTLVGIARALVTAPMILIADEPFAHLDDQQINIVVALMEAMHKKGTSIILFGKDAKKAQELSATVLTLKNGTIEQSSVTSHGSAKKADAHKILEEVDKHAHDTMEPEEEEEAPKLEKKKKIRITSIGSGLS